MITEALRFLVNTVFGFIVYAALLRFIMQCCARRSAIPWVRR